jgi:hypothetical protein
MTDNLRIPSDVQFRLISIHQQHLTQEFEFYKTLLKSHEIELTCLTLALVGLAITNYYLYTRLKNLEKLTNE